MWSKNDEKPVVAIDRFLVAILLIKKHLSPPKEDRSHEYLSFEGTSADQKLIRQLLILDNSETWNLDESLAETYLQMGVLILLYREPEEWLQGSPVRLKSSMIWTVAGVDFWSR